MQETTGLKVPNKRNNEIIGGVIRVLVKFINPGKIILFGSRAKGENNRHSDFDFAVEGLEPDGSIRSQINKEIETISGLYKVDIIFLESVDPEFKNIVLNTGKVIYERGN